MVSAGLPDPVCTPGAANPDVTQANIAETICVSGYTATIRPPTSYTTPLKIRQMAEYGFPGSTADYEEDHLIPLEVGGDPRDPRNLWPEPYAATYNARQKDTVENWAHAEVCAGRMPLADAQRQIAQNWIAVYLVIAHPTPAPMAEPTATPALQTAVPVPTSVSSQLVVRITSSRWGSVSATTASGAVCRVSVRFPSGSVSTAQGAQVPATADARGTVAWSYRTTANTLHGSGTNTVSCGLNGQSASVSAAFAVP